MASNHKHKTVLVMGATGQQGGFVTRELLKRGHAVQALVRDPKSPRAGALADLGAKLAVGSLNDLSGLTRVMREVEAIYAITIPTYDGTVGAEIDQGRTIANAALHARVQHVVWSSGASVLRHTGIPHFDSKAAIEGYLVESGLPHTILAPTFFLENYATMFPGLRYGILAMALSPDRKLQHVALRDLARLAAEAIERCDDFLGRRIEVASCEVSGATMVRVLTKAIGVAVTYETIPHSDLGADLAAMMRWYQEVGYDVDMASLHAAYPEIGWSTAKVWAAEQDWDWIGREG